jgi:CspA family cold shock protein
MAKRVKGRTNGPGVHSGRVLRWDDDEGWGVLGSDEFPGTVFAHFSHIQMEGYRTLTAGQAVEFDYMPGRGQDGCDHRALWVRPVAA